MLPIQPNSQPIPIKVQISEVNEEQIDCHPLYQRDIRWPQEIMCGLISAIMMSGLIPGIILYKLQPTDEKSKPTHKWECIDGQHRLFVLRHFLYGSWVELPARKKFMIFWSWTHSDTGKKTTVFFAKNENTTQWEAENPSQSVDYMTEEEKDHFKDFCLDIRKITTPMTMQQRRDQFVDLQKGVQVRGSDLYKNFTHIPIVEFITEQKRWEAIFKQKILDHCHVQPKNYWLNWVIRMHLIIQSYEDGSTEDAYAKTDSEINKMMKNYKPGHGPLNSTSDEETSLEMIANRFFSFLDTLQSTKLSPTHFYALFTHLIDADDTRETILRGHIDRWSNEGTSKKQKKMWENRGFTPEERIDYYQRCLDQLDQIKQPARDPGARTKIPPKVRDAVWFASFQQNPIGNCWCCKDEISKIIKNGWEAGHIIAHAHGGTDDASNLRPVCKSCNCSMGTKNMDEYKAQFYPQNKKTKYKKISL